MASKTVLAMILCSMRVLSLGMEPCEQYVPTQLGAAVLSSALSPDEGLVVFAELQKARQCFVLENELHTVYLVGDMLEIELHTVYLVGDMLEIELHTVYLVGDILDIELHTVYLEGDMLDIGLHTAFLMGDMLDIGFAHSLPGR